MAILQRDLRASDRDREDAVARLKASYLEGRLADYELDWRTDAAYRAVGVGELHRLTADLPAPPRARARRRPPVVPIALLVIAIAAWLVLVPIEVTLTLVLLFSVLSVIAVVLFSPVWIPVLLAFLAYKLIRTRLAQPHRNHRAPVI